SRFVFIVLIPIVVLLAILFTYIWPIFQNGINSLGTLINQSGNFGIFLYGMLERLLIPTGLHHLVYTPFLYTSLGGVQEVGGQIYEGARNIYFAEIANPGTGMLSKSVIWDARGISKMFGLVGACLAMYQTASLENKQKAKAILIPAAITSFVAGVTEPIEFSFMFVAPILFIIHSVLSGASMVLLNILNVRAIGPNGFIDFLLYNVPLGQARTNWMMYVAVGLLFFAIYYLLFRFLILKLNLKTIGREDEGQETKLYSKKEYKESKDGGTSEVNVPVAESTMASTIVGALGGEENIKSVTNCYTRLRLVLDEPTKVNEAILKSETGASGVVIKNNNVHVVYGLQVSGIRNSVDDYLGISEDE
ncbi:MAG: PTS transporter subunit EIIC, partial [Pisciglobus halotolerans]|nr:PTS transporter subunit EIIC [Pisciglobus halotolerans]